jgi:hypothetical protein
MIFACLWVCAVASVYVSVRLSARLLVNFFPYLRVSGRFHALSIFLSVYICVFWRSCACMRVSTHICVGATVCLHVIHNRFWKLFYEAISTSADCIAANGRIRVNDKLGGISKEAIVA